MYTYIHILYIYYPCTNIHKSALTPQCVRHYAIHREVLACGYTWTAGSLAAIGEHSLRSPLAQAMDTQTRGKVGEVCVQRHVRVEWEQTSSHIHFKQNKKQTNSVAFSPQANYIDWATVTCRGNLVPTFVDKRGVAWLARRIPNGR
jgi:hypothetical protein